MAMETKDYGLDLSKMMSMAQERPMEEQLAQPVAAPGEGKPVEDPNLYDTSSPIDDSVESVKGDMLADKIISQFMVDKEYKKPYEDTCVRAHLNFIGKYKSSFQQSGTSRAFVQVTAPRVINAYARIMEVLAPTSGEDIFVIRPSAMPSMPALTSRMLSVGASRDDISKAVKMHADTAAEIRASKIRDGLDETDWIIKCQTFGIHLMLYGTGIMFGPQAADADVDDIKCKRGIRSKIASGKVRPEISNVSPFEFYPQAGADDVSNMSHATIRRVVDITQLRDFLRKPDLYNVESIEAIMEANPDGDWEAEDWEVEVLGASADTNGSPNGRFVVLDWWGYLTGKDLADAGQDIDKDDYNTQVMANILVCCNRVISIKVSELFRDKLPFYVCPCFHIPHSIFGRGEAESMFDSQDAINAAERGAMDNLSLSMGPQVTVIAERLLDPNSVKKIVPNKIWVVKDTGETGGGDPVKMWMPDLRIGQLDQFQQNRMVLVQDQTMMPNALVGLGGEGVHNRTSSGAAMQYNSAIMPMKAVIRNIEAYVIIPLIYKLSEFYDMLDPNDDMNGDYKVVARGVSGVMAREAESIKLDQYMAAVAQVPEWAERIDIERLGSIKLRNMNIADEKITFSDTELQARREQRAKDKAVQETTMAKMQGDIELEQNQKQKAVTAPLDALIASMEAAPDNSVLKLMLNMELLKMEGMLTPQLAEAFNAEIAKQKIMDAGMIHESVGGQIDREVNTAATMMEANTPKAMRK